MGVRIESEGTGLLLTRLWLLVVLLLSVTNVMVAAIGARGQVLDPMDESTLIWESIDSGFSDGVFRDVSFLNATHGWIVGQQDSNYSSGAVILETVDAGDSWHLRLNRMSEYFKTIDILGEQTVWVTGAQGSLFYTVDGGATWNESDVAGAIGGMSTVEFINETHGWTGNNGVLYHTHNGGLTWHAVPGWAFNDHPRMIEVVSQLDIWASGYNGIYHSLDGGETWERSSSRGGWALSFVSDNEGWVVDDNRLAHTVDGQTWTELTVPMRYPAFRLSAPYTTDIQFVDEDNGWIVGDEIKVMYTPNGGHVWYEQSVPSEVNSRVMAVDFINATHGWAVGYDGVIMRTYRGNTLGGRLWMGFTDPQFLTILSVVGVAVVVIVGGVIGVRRRRRPADQGIL